MSVRHYTRAACDHCGVFEERDTTDAFTPLAWRHATVGYYSKVTSGTEFVADEAALLCDQCTKRVVAMCQRTAESTKSDPS
jgi:hypothetical protein